jgi:hypothetical protein
MALANAAAVAVGTASWTTVVTVTGDGTKQFIGAVLSCDDAAVAYQMRVQVNGSNILAPMNVPAGQSGVVYDSPVTIPNAQTCTVQAYQSSGSSKNFSGSLLGS